MGSARIEIFRKGTRRDMFPGEIKAGPFQIEAETTSTTATTSGSRHVVDNYPSYVDLHARVQVDEACYVDVGLDPTASATSGWKLAANVPMDIPVRAGYKFSFKDVA
jgi:hypothetical protein